ncbi:hypothetical protein [Cellulomonas phragmiteti]|uniref:Uncharacterized protein n=1 Tax=Cellulomonas phragmiteti TaxID=478780 RepID=A0ABQ4DH49_9CELL|nr:hypothetical protein [Cellulomonas phragmiteti]GIG38241.1 hypothetical protein Cph01nite_00030 [Cellulomonas phragmiteti]
MNETTDTTELRIDAGGLWAVRSTSATVCYLDLDRRRLLRARGAGSPVLPFDGVWVRLVRIASPRGDTGVVRVGDRHEFLTDPGGAYSDYRWWIPRACVAIERVSPADVPRT